MEQRHEFQERDAQPYLAIRRCVTEGMTAGVDDALADVLAWLRAHGHEPAGPPFVRFLVVDEEGDPVELEVGAPVAHEIPGDDRVRAGALPAGRYVSYVHVGPCLSSGEPDIGEARAAIMQLASDAGGSPLGCYVEHYRLGPVEDAQFSLWETELACLLDER